MSLLSFVWGGYFHDPLAMVSLSCRNAHISVRMRNPLPSNRKVYGVADMTKTPTYKYTIGYTDGTFKESDGCSLEYVARVLDDLATFGFRKNNIKTFLVVRGKE